jgi:hypothetical protein
MRHCQGGCGYRHAVLGAAAAAAFFRGGIDASERDARAAVAEGYPPDDPSPCLASQILGLIVAFQGRNDDSDRYLGAAETSIRGRDDEDYFRSRRHRYPDEALAALDQSVAIIRRGASTAVLVAALCYAAQAAAALGDADGARARLKDVLQEALRYDELPILTQGLDVAVDIFSHRGDAWAAAVLAGAVETTLAPPPGRSADFSRRGPALAARTANLARSREQLGDRRYEQARGEGVTMSRQDALSFALQHL